MNKKNSKIILVILFIIFISVFYVIKINQSKKLTYEEYSEKTNNYIEYLKTQYTDYVVSKPSVVQYPIYDKFQEEWNVTDINAIDNNLSEIKDKWIYFFDGEVVSKVTFIYSNNLKNKQYLSALRVHNKPYDADGIDGLPLIVNSMFYADGIFVNVLTFNKANVVNTDENKNKLFHFNTNITNSIMEYISDSN